MLKSHSDSKKRIKESQTGFRDRLQEKGQSLLEMAFVLPILLLLLVIVVDAGRAFDALIVLTNAAREGARFATLEPSPGISQIQQMVVDDVVGSGTNISNMDDFGSSDVAIDVGQEAVTVTVSYDFDLWFGGMVGINTFHLEMESVLPMFEVEP
jgi:Flp pilus assembly protein TadG